MFPADFAYARADSVPHALPLLADAQANGEEAKLLAGGQSLLPMMKLRLAAPQLLIDIAGIPGLSAVTTPSHGPPPPPPAAARPGPRPPPPRGRRAPRRAGSPPAPRPRPDRGGRRTGPPPGRPPRRTTRPRRHRRDNSKRRHANDQARRLPPG